MTRTEKPSRPEQDSSAATPNRDRRREPAVIDATAVETTQSDPPKAHVEPASAAETGPDPAPAVDAVRDETPANGMEPEAVAPAPAPQESPPKSSKLPLLVAILGGAALAIGGAAAIHWYNDGDAAVAALSDQTRTLEERIAALDARTSGLATSAALAALDTRLKVVEQRPVPAASPATPPPASAPGPSGDALATLERRIAAAETAARNAQSEAAAAKSAVSQAAAQPRPTGAAPAVPAVAAPPPVDLGPVQDRIGKLETRLATVEAGLATPKVEARATETRVEPTLSTAGVAALGVVAQSLVRSLERGAPFTQELAALQSLGLEKSALAPLEAVARTGARTPAALLAAFVPLAGEITTDRDRRSDASLLDRLSRSASNLVRVRPVGEVEGDTPADIAARIEAALRRGDLTAAHAEWASLPEDAKRPTAAWAALLDARLKADRAALAIQSDAIARLAQTKN